MPPHKTKAIGNKPKEGETTPPPLPLNSRQIYTPVFGKKYVKGKVSLAPPHTPGTIGGGRTPFANRAIDTYEAERDPIRTYLRLKPISQSKSLLQVLNDKEVEMKRTEDENTDRYLFAGVLPSLSQQNRVFEVCGQPVVQDVLAGYNSLLFTYGVTNSGKTYTVQGAQEAPGLMPRCVKALLDVLDYNGAQGDFAVRPKYATQTEYCSDPRVIAPQFRQAPGEDVWVAALETNTIEHVDWVEERAREVAGEGNEWVYQVYLSYVEVYNEMIYDLLDLDTLTTLVTGEKKKKTRGKRQADDRQMSVQQIAALERHALLLRSEGGRNGDSFVEGATEVRVRNVRDIVRVVVHGQLRRAVHATGLNEGSSRSHAVLQARVIKMRRDAHLGPATGVVPVEARASVRALTIVDLAGSERAKRTQAKGARLAEAAKINAGLMTLKKCLDVKRYNAALSEGEQPMLIPYNESKVTRMLQPALEGGARTIMVVCVDPSDRSVEHPGVRMETRGVLDFAHAASSLVAPVRRVRDPPPPPPKFSLATDKRSAVSDADGDVFFDALLGAGARKRKSKLTAGAIGTEIQTAMTSKRLRIDLAGEWNHPLPLMEEQPETPTRKRKPVKGNTEGVTPFTFESPGPLQLSRIHSQQKTPRPNNTEQANVQEHEQTVDELIEYAEGLERAIGELRLMYAQSQERSLRIEQETRAEVSDFFMAKINELQTQSAERLLNELERADVRSAHKIDILSRLRMLRALDGSDSDDAVEGASEVPTVSPRTAARRAVSRAASKKFNKLTSVSAGENLEINNLRGIAESLEAQVSSQTTQLDMLTQARANDRAAREALETALEEANSRASALEAHLMRLESSHTMEVEQVMGQAHERERAELVAQVDSLKAQLRDSETRAAKARRVWQTKELLPLQQSIQAMMKSQEAQQRYGAADADEALGKAERDRDNAWKWWAKEQARNSELTTQNDNLMREIHNLLSAQSTALHQQRLMTSHPPSPSIHSESLSDEDGFCKISLRSVDSMEALANNASKTNVDKVVGKARVLHRNPTKSRLPGTTARESTDSVALMQQKYHEGGKAKRAMSKMFRMGSHDQEAGNRPYLAGRFANTDTAVGSYSAEVFSFEKGKEPDSLRTRGNTLDTADNDQQSKVRAIKYSGPIVAHSTGGVSVTFTSQEVRDLPLGIPEEDEDVHMEEEPLDTLASTQEDMVPKASGLQRKGLAGKKKRKLYGSRTVLDVDGEGPKMGSSWPPKSSPTYMPKPKEPEHTAGKAGVAEPQESKQPVLYTPLRGRSKTHDTTLSDPQIEDEDQEDKAETMFMSPIKMLSRLRNRKK